MSQKYEKLKTLLKELFQLDQPDLDFGLYRIMHSKSAEVTQFLDKDLLPQVREAFAMYKTADKVEAEKELATAIEQAKGLGVDPEATSKVKELRARLKTEVVDVAALESEVYDHLFSFFRRYYSEGDFLAKRVYKAGTYAIPYEGEEVKLYWANQDQYYIKSSEYLRDYAFRLRPDDDQKPMRVHFRLADAAEGEHGNVKAAEGKERRFRLAADRAVSVGGGELVIRFTYQPSKEKQKELNAAAEAAILAVGGSEAAAWITELKKLHVRADGTTGESSRLRVHLDRYTARNTFDYFIHKDLGGFLRREIDFYIKNEAMHLDDIENETAPRGEQYLSKTKVIRKIAGKIIDFLAQIEDFQKKLWLKKKFVVETSWCISLGVVPKEFHAEVAENDAQREAWVTLCGIDQIKTDTTMVGYSKPLKPGFLLGQPTLMLDTRHFDAAFTSRLLESIGDVDAQTDGVLVHGDNSQALGLIQARYRGQVKCTYIDPPYNTGTDGFPYKDNYQHSTWMTMMADRLSLGYTFMSGEGVVFVSIDDNEQARLRLLMASIMGEGNFLANIIWQKKYTRANDARFFSDNHDFLVTWAKSRDDFSIGLLDRSDEQKAAYDNPDQHRKGPWKATPLHAKSGTNSEQHLFLNGVKWQPPPGTFHRYSPDTLLQLDEAGEIWFGPDGRGVPSRKSFLSEVKGGVTPVTIWPHDEAGHNHEAVNELKAIFPDNPFSNPKPCRLIQRIAGVSSMGNGDWLLDYFAGSGTSGHAIINLNREDGRMRKFLLVETGDHFDGVLLSRIMKVSFTPEWRDGKPARAAKQIEVERSPRIIKVTRLESYEDALNSLEVHRAGMQQRTLGEPRAQGNDSLREQYVLRYLLPFETRGSQSLLNLGAFADPTAYKLKVKRPGSDESRETNVDLQETFNWLIGLTVRHMAAPKTFTAAFERDSEGRLQLKNRLKEEPSGPYWFRAITGTLPDGRKALIVWRKLAGVPEQDNLVLDEWFTKQGYSSKDSEFDVIYVNGGNNLENLRTPDQTWKVRLIEEDFHRLMFASEGA